jgi:SAM-dependent methyltransferase
MRAIAHGEEPEWNWKKPSNVVPAWKAARRAVRAAKALYWGAFTTRAWPCPVTPDAMQGAVRVNAGCGRMILPGYYNVDRRRHDGAIEGSLVNGGLPFPDGGVDFVLARHVLEHVVDFGDALEEIRRVLKPGGILEAVVPYRSDGDNPYHFRVFRTSSLYAVCGPGNTLEGVPDAWRPLFIGITRRGFPWVQVQRALGLNLPVGRGLEMTFVLERVA